MYMYRATHTCVYTYIYQSLFNLFILNKIFNIPSLKSIECKLVLILQFARVSLISDIVECDTFNGGCAHICNNNAGSFFCTCNTGFVLSGDFGCDGRYFLPQ